jgi:hypothetical protein
MVTKEQVDKAKAEWYDAVDDAYSSWKTADAVLDSADAADAAYDRYLKLRQEYEDETI